MGPCLICFCHQTREPFRHGQHVFAALRFEEAPHGLLPGHHVLKDPPPHEHEAAKQLKQQESLDPQLCATISATGETLCYTVRKRNLRSGVPNIYREKTSVSRSHSTHHIVPVLCGTLTAGLSLCPGSFFRGFLLGRLCSLRCPDMTHQDPRITLLKQNKAQARTMHPRRVTVAHSHPIPSLCPPEKSVQG